MTGITVVKVGGELLEPADRLVATAKAITGARARTPRLMIVHGGGRAIDAALERSGIAPRQVDGLRITDAGTLDVVVSVLAGLVNTRLVAALNAAGTPAVGLTGVDARVLSVRAAAPVTAVDGRRVSLGFVGEPAERAQSAGDCDLAVHLIETGYVPVVASIGADASGALLNVNADTFAAAIAAALGADRLVIAGTTAGVLDRDGATIAEMTAGDATALIAGGTATAGMIAKLRACTHALEHGVASVMIAGGATLGETLTGGTGRSTVLVSAGGADLHALT